jgi:hypothetical protein
MIPRGVRFIDGSVFQNVGFTSITIEIGNERFVIREGLLIDIVDHKLIRNFTASSSITIPRDIEILGPLCFCQCGLFQSVSFESNSLLKRIESDAFAHSSLQSIVIPRNVKILCSQCFSSCKSLKSISFEVESRLTRIEANAFSASSLQSIVIPRGVRFIDGSAFTYVTISSISIESGNERFIIRENA